MGVGIPTIPVPMVCLSAGGADIVDAAPFKKWSGGASIPDQPYTLARQDMKFHLGCSGTSIKRRNQVGGDIHPHSDALGFACLVALTGGANSRILSYVLIERSSMPGE